MSKQCRKTVKVKAEDKDVKAGGKIKKLALYNPIEDNYKTEYNKLGQILIQTFDKIRFVLCVPFLFDDKYEILTEIVGEQHAKIIRTLMKERYEIDDSFEKMDRKVIGERVTDPIVFQAFLNQYDSEFKGVNNSYEELYVVIEYLFKNEQVRTFLKSLYNELSNPAKDFVNAIDFFFKYMLEQIQLSPFLERSYNYSLAKMLQQNSVMIDEIDRIKEEVESLSRERNELIKENETELGLLERDGEDLMKFLRENVKKNRLMFERKMDWNWKIHDLHYNDELEILRGFQSELEELIRTNLDSERDARIQKYKKVSQLDIIMEKYETNLDDKYSHFDELTTIYKQLRMDVAETEQKFVEQDRIYVELLDEKNQYDKEMWNRKLYKVQCSIAARKIQRFFRIYLKIAAKVNVDKGGGKRRKT